MFVIIRAKCKIVQERSPGEAQHLTLYDECHLNFRKETRRRSQRGGRDTQTAEDQLQSEEAH